MSTIPSQILPTKLEQIKPLASLYHVGLNAHSIIEEISLPLVFDFMPKRIAIAPHVSLEELERRYRQAKEPIERSHYQIIWLLASGRRSEDVAEITGYSRNWIYELVWGYNRVGPETLGDGRVGNPGAAPLLDDIQPANLWQALKGPAADGGLWNGRKVADYLSELIGQPISRQQGWEYR